MNRSLFFGLHPPSEVELSFGEARQLSDGHPGCGSMLARLSLMGTKGRTALEILKDLSPGGEAIWQVYDQLFVRDIDAFAEALRQKEPKTLRALQTENN